MLALLAVTLPAYGAGWTTQATAGPAGLAESALSGVSCVSSVWCMAVGVGDNGALDASDPLPGVASFAEIWNGSAWTVLPAAGPVGASPGLYAISCASEVFCIAVGQTSSDGWEGVRSRSAYGDDRALVEVWNGLAWTVQLHPGAVLSGSGLFDVSCTSSRFCIAIGQRAAGSHGADELAEIWDGTRWRVQHTPTVAKYGTWPMAISCTAADACTAVGGYNPNKSPGLPDSVPLAERWNGRRWSVQHAPSYGRYYIELRGVSCVSRTFCLATGEHTGNGSGAPGPFMERWNGQRWTAARAGLPEESSLNSVSCFSAADCVAVGQFDPRPLPSSDETAPLVERWNGSRWARVTVPRAPGPPAALYLNPSLFGVSCVARSGCTAVGAQAQGNESATLAQSNMGTPGAAPEVPLTQTSPTSATVGGGAGYRGQLTAANSVGTVTFTQASSADAANILVSPTGTITALPAVAPGIYTVSGADSDTTGDVGTWSFTLSITAASGLPPLGTPVFASSTTLQAVSGSVRVKLPGATSFVPLSSAATVPVGAIVDATKGRAKLTSAKDASGQTQAGLFDSGIFRVSQSLASSPLHGGKRVGLTVLTLAGPLPSGCTGSGAAASSKHKHGTTRRLWGDAKGNYRSVGRYGAATVGGTKWLTQDSCAGTLVRVARGIVSVNDFARHRTVLVRAPKSYLAKAGHGG